MKAGDGLLWAGEEAALRQVWGVWELEISFGACVRRTGGRVKAGDELLWTAGSELAVSWQ